MNAVIAWAAPLVLGVYLIHEHPFFRWIVWRDLLHINRKPEAMWFFPLAMVSIVTVFLIGLSIEAIRQAVFSWIERGRLFGNFCDRVSGLTIFKVLD